MGAQDGWIILERDGTRAGADISIWFEAALITERKKRKLMKKNSIQKKYTLTHVYFRCLFIYFVQSIDK